MFRYRFNLNSESDLETSLSIFKTKLLESNVEDKDNVYNKVNDIIKLLQYQKKSIYSSSINQTVDGEDYKIEICYKSKEDISLLSKVFNFLKGKS